jgi:hypothetical protein
VPVRAPLSEPETPELIGGDPVEKPPAGTKTAGRRLWKAILSDYDLDEHELTLLRQAIRVVDLCDDLQELLDAEGLLVNTPQGIKTHPAAVELRMQRMTLARLIVALRVPLGEQGAAPAAGLRTQRRGLRGPYGIRGAVS